LCNLRGIPEGKAVTLYTVMSEISYHNKSMNDFLSVAVSGPFRKMQNQKKLSTVDRSLYVHSNFLKQVLLKELTFG